MATTAVLFPGQGSLTPDAGERARELCPALVAQAEGALGADPFAHAAESTRFAQPAVFLASMAGWRERYARTNGIVAMAGHSLGELAALAAAGAFTPEAALELVIVRGRLMSESSSGGMVALLGATLADAEQLAAHHGLVVANDNAPGQVVLSGPSEGLGAMAAEARERGLRALALDVAGAFHSPSMEPVVAPFRDAIAAVGPREPVVPVVSGLTAEPFTDVAEELAGALVGPVRWRDVMARLVQMGAEDFVDAGPGRILARLADRNLKELREPVA